MNCFASKRIGNQVCIYYECAIIIQLCNNIVVNIRILQFAFCSRSAFSSDSRGTRTIVYEMILFNFEITEFALGRMRLFFNIAVFKKQIDGNVYQSRNYKSALNHRSPLLIDRLTTCESLQQNATQVSTCR